jgi:L-xylulokinase
MFADGLALPVTTTSAREVGALGAAMIAGIGVGEFSDLSEAIRATVHELQTFEPDPQGQTRMADAYDQFRRVVDGIRSTW